jgi:hypothetical protein
MQEEGDDLVDDSSFEPANIVSGSDDSDEPMREEPMSLSPPPSSRTRSVSSEPGERADSETLRLLPLVPRGVFEPIIMPTNCIWECPVQGCGFAVQFKGRLSRRILQLLSEDDIAFLKRRSWASGSPRGYAILGKVCASHFEEHITQVGLVIRGVSALSIDTHMLQIFTESNSEIDTIMRVLIVQYQRPNCL